MITKENAEKALKKITNVKIRNGGFADAGLYKYILLMIKATSTSFDPQRNNEIIFRELYKDFYKLNSHGYEKDEFISPYFTIMKEVKEKKLYKDPKNIEFVLNEIFNRCKRHGKNGYIELSYASKLMHTLNPSLPIWDSVLIPRKEKTHFANSYYGGIKNKKFKNIDKAKDEYLKYVNKFNEYKNGKLVNHKLNHLSGPDLIALFDKAYPNSGISDTKKIDFILWQDR